MAKILHTMSQRSISREFDESKVMYPPMNSAPPDFDVTKDLPPGLFEFLTPLSREFTSRQQQVILKRKAVLSRTHGGVLANTWDHLVFGIENILRALRVITKLFDEEFDRILRELPSMKDLGTPESLRQARLISETMIVRGEFDPV